MSCRRWFILLLSMALIVLFAAYFMVAGRQSIARPPAPDLYTIEYQITGTATTASLTMQNAQGGTEQVDSVRLPYSLKFEAAPGAYLYISAQNNGKRGTIICHILVNGVEARTATSDGAYVIATCSGRL